MIASRKILSLLLAVLLCFSLAACAEKDPSAVSGTTAPPASTAPQRAGLGPPVVGAIYPGKHDLPNTYSYDHHQDLVFAMQIAKMDAETQLFIAENVASDRDSVRNAVKTLVQQGANTIFSTEFSYSPHMLELAEDYPNVIFCQLGGTERNGLNLVDYFGELYMSYYLAGQFAGWKSCCEGIESIGFVSAYGLENPDAVAAINAFALGVRAQKFDATVYLKILDAPHDRAQEEAAANELVTRHGCGILAQYTNTDATLTTAKLLNIPACGPYFDADALARESVLISPQMNCLSFYILALRAAQDSTYATDFGARLGTARYYGGYNSFAKLSKTRYDIGDEQDKNKNDVYLKEIHYLVQECENYMKDCAPTGPHDTRYGQPLEQFYKGIFSGERFENVDYLNGELEIYYWLQSKDLLDNTGKVIIRADEDGLSVDEIRSMDYYLEGVTLVTATP